MVPFPSPLFILSLAALSHYHLIICPLPPLLRFLGNARQSYVDGWLSPDLRHGALLLPLSFGVVRTRRRGSRRLRNDGISAQSHQSSQRRPRSHHGEIERRQWSCSCGLVRSFVRSFVDLRVVGLNHSIIHTLIPSFLLTLLRSLLHSFMNRLDVGLINE